MGYSLTGLAGKGCQPFFYAELFFIKHRFNDRTETVDRTVIENWFGYDQDGNVIKVETMFQKGEVVSILAVKGV